MRLLRRFTVVSVAPLSAVLLLPFTSVHAQSAVTPANQVVVRAHPAPFAVQISPSPLTAQNSGPQTQPLPTYRLHQLSPSQTRQPNTLEVQKLALLAGNEANCYAMRTYQFTTPQDHASSPRLSGYTTCTPSAKAHVKELVKLPQATH